MATKRVLVTGGRDFVLTDVVHQILMPIHQRFGIEELGHGEAEGADTLSMLWALCHGIPTLGYGVEKHEWDVWGNRAGNMRNSRMLRSFKPDLGVAFPGATGTADMRAKLIEAQIPTLIGTYTDLNKSAVRWRVKNG
jgi:hypothetical protein